MSVTVKGPRARVCAGVDWAKDDHAVCIADADGEIVDQFTVEHTAAGLKRLIRRLFDAGVDEVGIERGDGPVVEALLAAGLVVLVIAPNQLKNLRSRYGSAGNKNDRYDTYVLADVIRTDRRRLTSLTRSTPATTALRSTVRARRDLVQRRVAAANQLRAHLQIVLPGIVGPFKALNSQTSLAFLDRFTTQAKVDWLTPVRLDAWLSKVGYSGKVAAKVLHQRLLTAPRGTTDVDADAHAATTLAFVAVLRTLNTQIAALADSIGKQFQAHPDAHIVQRFPSRHPARSPAPGRDRRRPRPVPHRRLASPPGWRRTLDPPIGQYTANQTADPAQPLCQLVSEPRFTRTGLLVPPTRRRLRRSRPCLYATSPPPIPSPCPSRGRTGRTQPW